MIQVVYDSQIFCTQKYGGISRYFCELASRMDGNLGVNATIVAPLYSNAYLRRTDATRLGCYVERRRGLPRLTKPLGWLTGKAYCLAARPDIVHETYYQRRSTAQRGTAVVVTVHDMIHEKFSDMFSRTDRTSEVKLVAVRRADRVICVSEQTRRDLIEITGIPENKAVTVHHGFSQMPRLSKKVHILSDKPYLLYVGERGGYKNFFRFLEAFAGSTTLRRELCVVAFGGGPFRREEQERIRALDLRAGQIRQLDGDDAALASAYRNAVAFVYPSLYEGFGIPPLEAMSQDCPVICSNTSSIPEVVGDAARMFNSNDVEEMRAAIEAVAYSESERLSLASRGRQRLSNFSWDRCASETAAIYQELAGS